MTRPLRLEGDLANAELPINSEVFVDIADDPFSFQGVIPTKRRVIRSLRDDPLGWMKSRDFIDDNQEKAGRRWQAFLRAAEIGDIRGQDPTREIVDTSRTEKAITDRQMDAIAALGEADTRLGADGATLVREVLQASFTIKECASRRGFTSKRQELYLGTRFRECLDTLAKLWGMRT